MVTSPHGARPDPYYWLRDDTRRAPAVLAHLRAENAWYEHHARQWAPLTDTLYRELVGRIQQDDATVPWVKGDFAYFRRYEKGKQHPIYVRRPRTGGREQVMLDVNALAKGHGFCEVANWEVSPDQRLLAYAVDLSGRRIYTLRIRDLRTGKDLPDTLVNAQASLAWGADSKRLFWIEKDRQTLLGNTLRRHTLGRPVGEGPVLYRERDESFYMGVGTTMDDSQVVLALSSTVSSEVHVLAADDARERLQVVAPRARDVQYDVERHGKRWIVRTDWEAPNFRLMTVADGQLGDRKNWRPLLAHDPKVFIESFVPFRDHLVVNERSEALERVRVMPWRDLSQARWLSSGEPVYMAHTDRNPGQDTTKLRWQYSSPTTPDQIWETDMATGARKLLKQQRVGGGFDAKNYVTERVWAPARDGVRVPVTLLHRKGLARNGTAPLYQYGYGAYGASISPDFDAGILSLVDRGFVYAIAHIRGGQELGRQWYEDGKLLKKLNTFHDFIDVTSHLVAEGWAAPDKVFAMGESAGGLLMGGVANMAPERYRAIIAHVPFVDAVTTMLDPSIPLTTNEYDEWGNPAEKAYHDYILSYSPYDRVKRQGYPTMLVTTGLHDSQVQYFEPAKWVAKLRTHKTDTNPLLFKVNMEAGHGGRSGRFEALRETAEEYAFVLSELGRAR
jgi:oligopeptidase B